MLRPLRVLAVTLGMAVVVGAMVAATGGAAKPIDSMTCSLSAGTTFTWISGTTVIDYEFDRADNTATAIGTIVPSGNGPGSDTITTPSDAVILKAIFGNRRGPAAKLAPVSCTA